jgi:hypothetical protein
MNYTPLIKKLLAGEELNALERAELETFDADALIGEKNALSQERDQLRTEHSALKRGQKLREVAQKYSCGDPDFLDFLAARDGVDLEDDRAVNGLIEQMRQNNPHCFYSRIRSGGGTVPAVRPAGIDDIPEHDRIGRIAASLAGLPEKRA